MLVSCRVSCNAVLLVSVLAASVAGEPPGPVPLGDSAKFAFGDDSAWSAADFDDTDWLSIRVPEAWLREVDPLSVHLAGWYRFRVALPESARDWSKPAIVVGVISDACEVYVNGEMVGGVGVMMPRADGVPLDPLVATIPKKLLRFGEENVVAVRVHRCLFDGGIIGGPIQIGDAIVLEETLRPKRFRAVLTEGAVTAVLAAALAYSLLLIAVGVRDDVYVWLAIGSALLFFGVAIESRVWANTFGFSATRRVFDAWATIPLPFVTHAFIAAFYGRVIGRRAWQVKLSVVGTLCAMALVPVLFGLMVTSWMACVLALLAIWIHWAVRAVRAKTPDSLPMLLGLTGLGCGILQDIINVGGVNRIAGQYPSVAGVMFFYACGMAAMTQRYQRARTRASQATAEILTAHEEERKRLARELHDGVVQSLLAIQLNMQIMRGAHQADQPIDSQSLDRAIEELQTTGEELRRVSHDLRPEMLERLELADAIRAHAGALNSRIDPDVVVVADSVSAAASLKDHLYRIYQEAVLNAVKHAAATRIDVRLESSGRQITLTLQDNGQGIDEQASGDGRVGVGLTTIHERAELLGGRATVKSSPTGTTITVEVPQ